MSERFENSAARVSKRLTLRQKRLLTRAVLLEERLLTRAVLLELLSPSSHVGEDFLDAELVNSLDSSGRDAQPHPAAFARNPETVPLQVRLEAALCSVVGVRNIVAGHRFLAGHLTFPGHNNGPPKSVYDYETRDYTISGSPKARGGRQPSAWLASLTREFV